MHAIKINDVFVYICNTLLCSTLYNFFSFRRATFFPQKTLDKKRVEGYVIVAKCIQYADFFRTKLSYKSISTIGKVQMREPCRVNYFSVISKITFSNHSDNIPMITDFFMTVPLCSSFTLLN